MQPSGQILLACSGLFDLAEVGVIGFVSVPASGDAVLAPRIVVGDEDGEVQIQFTAIAVDPTARTTWAAGGFDAFDGTDFGWFRVDAQQQTIGPAIPPTPRSRVPTSTAPGSSGRSRTTGTCSDLLVVDPTTGAAGDDHGCLEPAPGQPTEDIQPITVWGGGLGGPGPGPGAEPSLPATGTDVFALVLAPALLLAVGATLALRRGSA